MEESCDHMPSWNHKNGVGESGDSETSDGRAGVRVKRPFSEDGGRKISDGRTACTVRHKQGTRWSKENGRADTTPGPCTDASQKDRQNICVYVHTHARTHARAGTDTSTHTLTQPDTQACAETHTKVNF